MKIRPTWIPDEDAIFIRSETGYFQGLKGLKQKVAVIPMEPFHKYNAYTMIVSTWEAINDGVIEQIEFVVPKRQRTTRVNVDTFDEEGSLQYTVSVADAIKYGLSIDTPWGMRFSIPLSVCKRAQWKEQPKGDITECQTRTTQQPLVS